MNRTVGGGAVVTAGPGERRCEARRPSDDALVAAVHGGSQPAMMSLVERYHRTLLRLARHYVRSDALAADVVQDTWVGVLQGIGRFEGRSSFRTWLYRVMANRARSRAVRETRYLSYDWHDERDWPEDRLDRSGAGSLAPRLERMTPERLALSAEARRMVVAEMGRLPPKQRDVIELRVVRGIGAADACRILGVSKAHERVLLHRGRRTLQAALVWKLGRANHPLRPRAGVQPASARGPRRSFGQRAVITSDVELAPVRQSPPVMRARRSMRSP